MNSLLKKYQVNLSQTRKNSIGCDLTIVITMHTENQFLNLVKSNQSWILITLFWFILYQTDFHLEPNQ